MSSGDVPKEVEDSVSWEAGFRTHVDLFRSMTISEPILFTTNEKNEVAILLEPEDLDKYMAGLDSAETAEAMSHDGVKRETVKVFVLDKDVQL